MGNDLLAQFMGKSGAKDEAIFDAESALQWKFPQEYIDFIKKSNGGEGFFGINYLILWKIEELVQFNEDYGVSEYAPGLVIFGSSGAGEGYAFDLRENASSIVQVPFIGMSLTYARMVAAGFNEFLKNLANENE